MKQYLSLMQSHLTKMDRIFKLLLTLITLIELVMMLRGFAVFNLTRIKHRLYLYSYIFLFATSLITLVLFCIFNQRKRYLKALTAVTHLYAFCLIMWSALVSCIDCYANGDSGIMVYVMTCTAVGILTLIRPHIFFGYLTVSSTFILIFTAFIRNWQPYSSGFYINFFIFMTTAVFINAHNYQLSRREHEAAQKLEKLSYTDQLTGVYNRRSLDEQTKSETKEKLGFHFVLLDIDDFKNINDTFGHPKGDACLITLAQILSEHFGKKVYRFGGDEFALISEKGLEETCRHLDLINQELSVHTKETPFQISAGIYTAKIDDLPDHIFARADQALYEAKQTGKARWSLYSDQYKHQ